MSENKCYTDPTHKESETNSRTDKSQTDNILNDLIVHLAKLASERDYRELLETLDEGHSQND